MSTRVTDEDITLMLRERSSRDVGADLFGVVAAAVDADPTRGRRHADRLPRRPTLLLAAALAVASLIGAVMLAGGSRPPETRPAQTPSPLLGSVEFMNPFGYQLAKGEGLVVDTPEGFPIPGNEGFEGPVTLVPWVRFAHPDPDGDGWDRGVTVRYVYSLRTDPCDSEATPALVDSPEEHVAVLRTIPDIVVSGSRPRLVPAWGQLWQGLEVDIQRTTSTSTCPDFSLWNMPPSAVPLEGPESGRLTIVNVGRLRLVFNSFGPPEFMTKADKLIDSLEWVQG